MYKGRKCLNSESVPQVLKCAVCAESKGSSPFSVFFCKQKHHGDLRAQVSDLKKELEKYIGKLGTAVVDSKIQLSVNYIFQRLKKKKKKTKRPN